MGGWCHEPGTGLGDNVMWSVEGGKGVMLEGLRGDMSGGLFSSVRFPELCQSCTAQAQGKKQQGGVCESPLFQELLKGLDIDTALSIACVNRPPSERRFGLELLAVLAEKEEWTLRGRPENQYLGCLQTYLDQQFLQLVDEGKVVERVDQSGRATWACFCTGLLSQESGELLYCIAKRAEDGASPAWLLHAFVTASKLQDGGQLWNQGCDVIRAPSKATFFASVSDLVFDIRSFSGEVDADSEVWTSLDSVRAWLPRSLQDADSHLLQKALSAAAKRSVNRARVDPFQMVPQFVRERSAGKIQALLPLELEGEVTVALVLDVERSDTSATMLKPRQLAPLPSAYSAARVLTPQHQPWILRACLGSSPPGTNAWPLSPPEQYSGHSTISGGNRHLASGDPRFADNAVASPPKLIPTLSGLHIDPPDLVNPPNPEDGEKGQSHPGSRGSSDAWITGSLGQGGPFNTTMFGSGPSSESGQCLSPLRRSPPLDEHRAYSHPEDPRAYSHQEARAEQMYREMAPRFEENRPRSGVNIPQEPQVSSAALAAASFSSGFSGGSLASLKASGSDSGLDVPGRAEELSFMRMYGGFRDESAMREALNAAREGANVARDVTNVSRDGVNGPREGVNMPRDVVSVPRDSVSALREAQLSNGGHLMNAFSRAPDGWIAKQDEGARLSLAFEQERRSELDRDSAQHLEFYRSQQLALPVKPPARLAAHDPWARDYAGFSPEALEHRSEKDDSIFVEFSPQDDLCPKVNISQLPAKFVATFLSGDPNRPGFEYNAEQYAEQLFSRYGAVSKTLVRENKNHPGKWFAIVEFSYWTNEEVRQRLVAGEQIRFANFFDGEDVYVRRHKDKQSKMLRSGSGPSSGLPCRPDWKYTGTDTRLGKPLYRGPCSMCGRESTVPFKPVINGQPPRCRTCLPQDGNFAAAGGYTPQAMPPPRYEEPRDGGLMSLRKETLRTLSGNRVSSEVFLSGGAESGRSGPPHYGMDHQGFSDLARAQSFAGGDVSRAVADASRGHSNVSKFAREYGSSVTGMGAPPTTGGVPPHH
ncbi:hypothetical protein KFL_005240030 [Klebsormidium nitens]|uniref:DUF3825 domain-containing protein n=1 Tax=Klebsormidium nitens TaxID=105231 RepID=A0A1Y1IFP2_KLENI|nr:hypothetical protein KFL_005240030 [Klebsormidium nitens]|eukprot:GAQ89443.1 hypothetical protein KFL_005240030 [Klebsormidium nitens]